MKCPNITAIVNLHAEGSLAAATLASLVAAQKFAQASGISVELIAVLDSPTVETTDFIVRSGVEGLAKIEVSFRDLGKSRNVGIEIANGEWVSFLDGDDLWSENWLAAAYHLAFSGDVTNIYHPQTNIYFGSMQQIYSHVDMDDYDFDLVNLTMSNYWTALCFAHKQTFVDVPYSAANFALQIGYEDWGWNMDTIAKGHRHKCVPETLHAIRKSDQGLNKHAYLQLVMPPTSDLFRDRLVSGNGRASSQV